jgi:HAD superfamily hydrolase (TIGR01509 family)
VIFDFDGTLTDSREDIAGAQLWSMEQIGFAGCPKEELFPHIGKPLAETFALVLPPDLHARIPEAVALYSEYYPPRSLRTTTLFPGVEGTLRSLRAAGKRLAIASTKRGAGLVRATRHFGIIDLFDQLQGSDVLPYKPDPAILHKVVEDQKWDRSRTLMVGDTGHDIRAGQGAGVATCGITHGSLSRTELASFQPDFIIDSIPELLPLLKVLP